MTPETETRRLMEGAGPVLHPAFAAQVADTAPRRLRSLLLAAAQASEEFTRAASRTPQVSAAEWDRLTAAEADTRQALLDHLLFEEGILTAEAGLFGRVF